eukprot:scaffold521163_cov23-Prasinocladus_malaysianus.AAC.1
MASPVLLPLWRIAAIARGAWDADALADATLIAPAAIPSRCEYILNVRCMPPSRWHPEND